MRELEGLVGGRRCGDASCGRQTLCSLLPSSRMSQTPHRDVVFFLKQPHQAWPVGGVPSCVAAVSAVAATFWLAGAVVGTRRTARTRCLRARTTGAIVG